MSAQALIPGTDDPRFDEIRIRERELDMTPRPVVEQLVEYLRTLPRFRDRMPDRHGPTVVGGGAPRRILDPAAGAGVFAAVAHDVWPEAEIATVEPAEEETDELRAAARRRGFHFPMTFQVFARACSTRFDLIATNPPFSRAREFVEIARSLLTDDGVLVLLLRSSCFQRGTEAVSWLLAREPHHREGVDRLINLPEEVLHVSGPISFRGRDRGGGAASIDSYSWWIWGPRPRLFRSDALASWEQSQLPMLPGSARRWSQRPGSEIDT